MLGVISAFALAIFGFLSVHAQQAKLMGAFIVGFFGAVAYITALYFKFIGLDDPSRAILKVEKFIKSV